MNSKSIILSVSVQSGCYRHLQVPMDVTLERLAEIILSAFGFDNDHGHAFFMDNKAWSKNACYYSQGSGNAKATTKRQKLQSLELEKGSKFKFLFDFGDEWLFQCAVLGLSEESVSEPLIIKSKGEAPPQYPESCDVYEDEDNDEAACGEESGMPAKLVPDAELLDAAFAYKETRLWKKLWDTDVFAVKLPHGEIGYCCIMGRNGRFCGVSVFLGRNGWNTYLGVLQSDNARDDDATLEILNFQDQDSCEFTNKSYLFFTDASAIADYAKERGIQLRGANAYPEFTRYSPGAMPWMMSDKAHREIMREAFLAAIEVARRINAGEKAAALGLGVFFELKRIPLLTRTEDGFTWETIPVATKHISQYPSPAFSSPTAIKKLPKNGKWECGLFYLPEPTMVTPGMPPVYMAVLMAVEPIERQTIMTYPIAHYHQNAEEILSDLKKQLLSNKICPKSIAVMDTRTELLLRDFCSKCGIILISAKKLPAFENEKNQLLENIDAHDDDPISDEELFSLMLEQSENALAEMPVDLIHFILDNKDIPDELRKKLERVLKRHK